MKNRMQNTEDRRQKTVDRIRKRKRKERKEGVMLSSDSCLLHSYYMATFTGVGFKTSFKTSGDISARSPLLPALI